MPSGIVKHWSTPTSTSAHAVAGIDVLENVDVNRLLTITEGLIDRP